MIGPGISYRAAIVWGSIFSTAAVFEISAWQPGSTQARNGVEEVVEWFRIIGGLIGIIGTLLGGIGVWAYYKTTIRAKTTEGLEAALDIYKDMVEAMKLRDAQREQHTNEVMTALSTRDAELATLRSRTDLTEVIKTTQLMMKTQNELLDLKKTHDADLAHAIAAAVQQGDRKYAQVTEMMATLLKSTEERDINTLKVLTTMLEQSGRSLEGAFAQAKQNHEAIKQLLRSVDTLSRRFGVVEDKVDSVASAVENGSKPSEERPEPPAERRRHPR